MRVLLVRAVAPNERFGLGPFFRIESLGMKYVAAALEAAGHDVRLVDMRFASLGRALERLQPEVVGIAAAHTLDANEALAVAAWVKALRPSAFVVIGGHAAAVYPGPFQTRSVDAICCEDGEQAMPELVAALEHGTPLDERRGMHLRDGDRFLATRPSDERVSLDLVPRPARHLMRPSQHHFMCLDRRPVYLVETARGCPFRCSFCTIWRHVDRSYRVRAVEHVVADLASVGENVFIADDLFFHPARRSIELAEALRARGVHKKWILVQTRTDLVAQRPEVLAAWRGIADDFDVFFGFEAPTDEALDGYRKDSGVDDIREALRVCRRLQYGVTGNFIVDPDWTEHEFQRLWDFTAVHDLRRVGYTIMTPLPGTPLFDEHRARIVERDWARYDMHHVLWEPRLGRHRFFELFAESWRRTVLNARGGHKKPWTWLRNVKLAHVPRLARVLYQTQQMMDPACYFDETFPVGATAETPPATSTGG